LTQASVDGCGEVVDERGEGRGLRSVHASHRRQRDQLESLTQMRCQLVPDPGEIRGHETAPTGHRFDQNQGKAFVEGGENQGSRPPHLAREIRLPELTVRDHDVAHAQHPTPQTLGLRAAAAACDVQLELGPGGAQSLDGVEQTVETLGVRQLADVQKARNPIGRPTFIGEDRLVESRADDPNPGLCDAEGGRELPRMTAVQHREGIVGRAAGAYTGREVRAQCHLAQAGGVAVGDHRGRRRDLLEQ
jgi:hypothetical protein